MSNLLQASIGGDSSALSHKRLLTLSGTGLLPLDSQRTLVIIEEQPKSRYRFRAIVWTSTSNGQDTEFCRGPVHA